MTHVTSRSHILCTLLLAIIVAACNPTHDPRLQRADSLMEQHPDSALAILSAITDRSGWNCSDSMFAELLTIQAKDKAYVPTVSDSSIRQLLEYYIDGKQESYLHSRVFYYAGRTYYDLGRPELALRYFKAALKEEGENGNPDLLACIHSQISGLYFDNRLYRHALREVKKELRYSRMNPDSSDAFNNLLRIAFNYRMLNQRDSARQIYEYLKTKMDTLGNEITRSQYYTQVASFLKVEGRYREADSLISTHHYTWNPGSAQSVLHILSEFDNERGDSSRYTDRMITLLNSPDLYPRQQAAGELAGFYLDKGRTDSALFYTRMYASLTDTMLNRQGGAPLREVEAMLQESELEKENISLKSGLAIRNLTITLTVASILLLITIILFLRSRSRVRIAQKELEFRKTALRLHHTIEEGEKIAEAKNRKIRELDESLSEIEKKYKESKHKLDSITADIDLRKITAGILDRKLMTSNMDKEETFVKIIGYYSVTLPEFIVALKGFGLQKREMDDALLIKLGIPQNICAEILNISASGLANVRSRLLKSRGLDNRFKNWTDFIMSL